MRKTVLSGLLAAVICLCLLPAGTALAADGIATSVKIGGATLDAEHPYYVNGESGAQGTAQGAEPTFCNARFVSSTGTLYLNGLNISVAGSKIETRSAYVALYAKGDLTIELAGDSFITNTATATSDVNLSFGIYCEGKLTVRGNGALTCKGGPVRGRNKYSYGVYAPGGIAMTGGALTGIGNTADIIKSGDTYCRSCGIYTGNGNIKVNGGALTGVGGEASTNGVSNVGSYGVQADGGAIEVENGTLSGAGGSGRTSVGVEGKSINIKNRGTVTGRGGSCGAAHSFGIYTKNHLIINAGGALIGTSSGSISDDDKSSGAYCGDDTNGDKNILIDSGGAVTLQGATSVLFKSGSALKIDEDSYQYKYRVSQGHDSIPTDFTLSSTKKYTHNSAYNYVQILPAAHPIAPTGIKLSPDISKQGVTLTASIEPPYALTINGSITAIPRYQWYTSSSKATTGGTPISGATSQSYCPTSNDIGKYLYVTAKTYDHFGSVSACADNVVEPVTEASFTSLTANGSDTETTTDLTLAFDKAIEGLAANDITLDVAAKGTLSTTSTIGTYTLGISGVSVADGENVTATLSKEGFVFSPASRTTAVRVYVAPSPSPSPTPTATPTPTTSPTPTFTPSGGGSAPLQTAVHSADHAIWLTGAGLSASDSLVTETLSSGGSYNAMMRLAGKEDVFRAYSIHLKSGISSTGYPFYLHFDLAAKYAGQAFTLIHETPNGTYEYFYATADANGDLTFGPLYSLSPFLLAKGTLAALQPYDVVDLPKTGDSALSILLSAALALAGTWLAVSAARMHRRKTRG